MSEQAATQLELMKRALEDRYAVQRELGRGGMATVFLAEERHPHRQVAIKVLDPTLAAALGRERFLREVDLAANLTHPHILPVYSAGEAQGLLYYVMPYVAGESLRERLNREKQLPFDDAVRIAREVADALSHAHGRGVVHRDIKPENILLQSGHAVVGDFGIARAITAAGGEKLTGTGVAIGTPAYMSPEQAAGSKDLDGRSDLYALGCVLYEMLAGEPPFTGSTVESVLRQHLTVDPPNVTGMRSAVPAHVAAALQRALAKSPADRFGSVAMFVDALADGRSGTVVSAGEAAYRRRRSLLLIAASAIVVVGGAFLILRAVASGSPRERTYARTAIAVLPFANLSADSAHAYFAGGLHDELLTQLSKVAALSLRGRTSVMGYAGTTKPIRQIAEELQVGTLVLSTVQVVGRRLRVNVQLVAAATDEHLWADTYDRTLDDAFAIQSDIAQRVVAALGAALGGAERVAISDAPTANAEAYRFYLQGREYLRRPGYQKRNLENAQQLFERALALDPAFALAYASLAEAHGEMHWYRYDTSPERVTRLREAAEAALRLAPALPQAHQAIAQWHLWGRRNLPDALAEFEVAQRGLPNDPWLAFMIGHANRRLGNWDKVFQAFERAAELDPRDVQILYDLGANSYQATKQYPEALRIYDRALSLAPDLHIAAVWKGWAYVRGMGQVDTLREILRRLPWDAELNLFGSTAAYRAELLLWTRAPERLIALLDSVPALVLDGIAIFYPKSLYLGWANRLRGDKAAARAAFESADVLLDSVLAELPNDWRVHAARGHVFAGLGRRREALSEARSLERSVVYREGDFYRTWLAGERARILAQAGAADAALDEIERLLAGPSWLTVHTLRLDPLWDPIREHPRFRALVARYEVGGTR